MIIFFEGVDGSGKTTLMNKVYTRLQTRQRLFGLTPVLNAQTSVPTHPSAPDRSTEETLLEMLSVMASIPDVVYLHDRGPLSDIIYRTFDEHKPILDFFQLWYFTLSNMFGVMTVHCDTADSSKFMIARGEDNLVALSHHKSLRYLFDQFASVLPQVTTYDFVNDDENELINTILAELEKSKRRLAKRVEEQRNEIN